MYSLHTFKIKERTFKTKGLITGLTGLIISLMLSILLPQSIAAGGGKEDKQETGSDSGSGSDSDSDADSNLLIFYFTGNGIQASFGKINQLDPVDLFAVHMSSEPELDLKPISLTGNITQPIRAFNLLMDRKTDSLRQKLKKDSDKRKDKKAPMHVYFYAPHIEGLRGAMNMPFSEEDKKNVQQYLTSNNKHCIIPEEAENHGRADFFTCMFLEKIQATLPDAHIKTKTMDDSSHLIATMAYRYAIDSNIITGTDELLAVHTTTEAIPHLVKNGVIQRRNSMHPPVHRELGGIKELGKVFVHEELMPLEEDIRNCNEDNTAFAQLAAQQSELVRAVYNNEAIRGGNNLGALANFSAAVKKDSTLTYLALGNAIKNIAASVTTPSIGNTQSIISYDPIQANSDAGNIIGQMERSLLSIIINFLYREKASIDQQSNLYPRGMPPIVLVGDQIDVFEFHAKHFHNNESLSFILSMIFRDMHFFTELKEQLLSIDNTITEQALKQWLGLFLQHLVQPKMIPLPSTAFFRYLHLASIIRLNELGKTTFSPTLHETTVVDQGDIMDTDTNAFPPSPISPALQEEKPVQGKKRYPSTTEENAGEQKKLKQMATAEKQAEKAVNPEKHITP